MTNLLKIFITTMETLNRRSRRTTKTLKPFFQRGLKYLQDIEDPNDDWKVLLEWSNINCLLILLFNFKNDFLLKGVLQQKVTFSISSCSITNRSAEGSTVS